MHIKSRYEQPKTVVVTPFHADIFSIHDVFDKSSLSTISRAFAHRVLGKKTLAPAFQALAANKSTLGHCKFTSTVSNKRALCTASDHALV